MSRSEHIFFELTWSNNINKSHKTVYPVIYVCNHVVS